jgi:hypothetical protein
MERWADGWAVLSALPDPTLDELSLKAFLGLRLNRYLS